MRKTIFLLSFFNIFYCSAQIKAVTESGDEVILYNDKSWDYTTTAIKEAKEISTNSTTFTKNKDATFNLKSKILPDVVISINPKKWSFKKEESEAEAEFTFQLKDKDAYGMIITERIEIPLESLKEIALDNARKTAPDIRVVMEEYRNVNDRKILCMQMDGTTQGVKFSYYGYYFSYDGGTIQFLTYTSQSLLKEYKAEMEDFLNGFSIK